MLWALKRRTRYNEVKPRDTKEPILNKSLSIGILILSIAQTAAVLVAFRWALNNYNQNLEIAQTMAFATLVVVELVMAFTCRSERYPVIKLGIFSNRSLVLATITSFVLALAVLYIYFCSPYSRLFHWESGIGL